MCDAGMVVGAVLSLASTAYSMHQQNEYADRMEEQAYQTAALDEKALDLQEAQLEDQAELDSFERERQQKREAARIRTAAAEAGVFGNNQLRELNNSLMQSGYDKAIIDKNLKNKKQQTNLDRKRVKAGLSARLNEADSNRVSGLGAGLSLASAGMAGANSGYATSENFKKALG